MAEILLTKSIFSSAVSKEFLLKVPYLIRVKKGYFLIIFFFNIRMNKNEETSENDLPSKWIFRNEDLFSNMFLWQDLKNLNGRRYFLLLMLFYYMDVLMHLTFCDLEQLKNKEWNKTCIPTWIKKRWTTNIIACNTGDL